MFDTNKTKSLLLVAIMLVTAVAPAMAAAPTVDTETTNTTQTSDLTDGGTQTYNTTTNRSLGWSADSPNSSVEITQNGETLFEATPEHYNSVDTGSDSNPDLWYFNVTLADDGSDYDGLDVDAGASTTLNVTIVNDTTIDNPDTQNISYTFANGNEIAFEDVDGSSVVNPTEDGLFSGLNVLSSDDETDPAKIDESTVGIVGNETETVTVSVADTAMADAFGAAAESTESGDVIWASATSVGGDYIAVSNQEAPDTDWFNDSNTYATFDDDAETLTIHNVDESVDDGAEEVELSATGNDGLGLFNTASMIQSYGEANWGAWTTAATNWDWNEPNWEDEE